MKPRRFKLRNGIIVQEDYCRPNTYTNKGGYIDDYTAIHVPSEVARADDNAPDVGEWICLSFDIKSDKLPDGGVYGKDYDIIEEVSYE